MEERSYAQLQADLVECRAANREYERRNKELEHAVAQWRGQAESLEARLRVLERDREELRFFVADLADEPFLATPQITEKARELMHRGQ